MNNLIKSFILGSIFCVGLMISGAAIYDVVILDEQQDIGTTVQPNIVESANLDTDNSMDNSTTDVVKATQDSVDSVVSIHVKSDGEAVSQGSGFVYSDKHIITNEHVVNSGDVFYVQYRNGEWANATLVGKDVHTDIGVLEVETRPNYANPADIKTSLPQRGEEVVAIGNPNNLDSTVTTGTVSGTERTTQTKTGYSIPDMIQTDAALNPGNSGGPLIDVKSGSVIGVNRAKSGENIGFAISARMMTEVANDIIENGDANHPVLGVRTVPISPSIDGYHSIEPTNGLAIIDVLENGPAMEVLRNGSEENILGGDIIIAADGKVLRTNEDLSSHLIRNKDPDDEITLTIYRDGSRTNVTVELDARE